MGWFIKMALVMDIPTGAGNVSIESFSSRGCGEICVIGKFSAVSIWTKL